MRAKAQIALVCLLALTILGCGTGNAPQPWVAPVAVDLAPTRCPDPDPKIAAESKRTTRPPATKAGLSVDDAKELIDALRLSEARKNAALARSTAEHRKCIDSPSPPANAAPKATGPATS